MGTVDHACFSLISPVPAQKAFQLNFLIDLAKKSFMCKALEKTLC